MCIRDRIYTGGLYAGSGVKFYLEDETGGIQVYVPGGSGSVDVPMGAFVRVKGIPQPYRGAIELVPSTSDVLILKQPEASIPKEPSLRNIDEMLGEKENFAGELVTISGEVTRVEEFSYSYELDLLQADAVMGVYVDKLTLINVEAIEVGQYYQITGIAEMLDDEMQIYPRVQDDLVEIQPPAVTMEVDLPVNYSAGENFTLGITVTNYLSESVHDLQLFLEMPEGFTPEDISEGGKLEQGNVTWNLAELSGKGSQVKFIIDGKALPGQQFIKLENYSLTYIENENTLIGETCYSFPGDTVPVWAIQGKTFRSPYVLQSLSTTGIVTGVFPDLEGFWIQGEMDDEENTSQGLFIFDPEGLMELERGDNVEVAGTVHESHGETQLFLETISLLAENRLIPSSITLDPPADEIASEQYYEQLEGMLVQVKGSAVAVSATNKYGETALILPGYDIAHLMQGSDNGMAIRVDDGSFVTHTDQTTMTYAAATGDTLSGISGPLAYNYGYYKIEPLSPPQVFAQDRLLPSLPEISDNQVRIMTWNVENLFDFLLPHPTDPALPSVSEYKANITKIANTIALAGFPVVIGFQEVEHIGILEDLAESPQLSPSGYQAVLLEGTDSRGIDVGYLVRGDAVTLEVQQYAAPNELTSRPPLMLKVETQTGSGTQVLYLLNNHFLSMSGGEKATEPRRVAQAAWNVQIVEQIHAQDPGAQIILMGDLNSYFDSPPIDVLRDSGLVHVFDFLLPEDRYTYIYQGVAQVLDHILINSLLENRLSRVDILHTNADFPLQPSGDTSILHKSDHDPVVITLDF
jgi:predicted extracellular nuclease